ncbi:hypothetical protein [Variovorax sp. HJSM1_2]|uniref:hypothetical protein n=1 Tax=Variovorax sp. HJSM1_2 TaxID=3366263 RepID=UPI003BC4B5DB
MKKDWRFIDQVVAATVGFCVLFSCGYVYFAGALAYRTFLENSAPAWVQAIGSVIAIYVAVHSVQKAHTLQSEQKKRDEHDEVTRSIEALFQLLYGIRSVAYKLHQIESVGTGLSPLERQMAIAELAALANALTRLDTTRLDDYEYIGASIYGDTITRHLPFLINQGVAPHVIRMDAKANLLVACESYIEELDTRNRKICLAIEARGGRPCVLPVGAPADGTIAPHVFHPERSTPPPPAAPTPAAR